MGFRRITKKSLRYLAPTLLVLLIIPFTSKRDDHQHFEESDERSLRCAICLHGYDSMEKGYVTGYAYETLKMFTDYINNKAEIFISEEKEACIDSLLADSLDMVVVPYERTDLPEELSSSIPLDSTIMWVYRSSRNNHKVVNQWLRSFSESESHDSVRTRFFDCYNPYRKTRKGKALISPYDDLFRKYASAAGFDWRLVASIAWSESRFRIQSKSPRGARGLMQMVPRTADRFGVESHLDPEENIKAGTEYLAHLRRTFRNQAANEDELDKFTLAAYNAGEGRILDCSNFAKSIGVDCAYWDSLKTVFPKMSVDSAEFMEGIKLGKFYGIETTAYVDAVLGVFRRFRGMSPQAGDAPLGAGELNMIDSLIVLGDSLGIFSPAENPEASLMGPDSLGRVNPGNEETRNQEEEHDDDVGEKVSGQDGGKIEVHGDE